jgi:hypothetical protein
MQLFGNSPFTKLNFLSNFVTQTTSFVHTDNNKRDVTYYNIILFYKLMQTDFNLDKQFFLLHSTAFL